MDNSTLGKFKENGALYGVRVLELGSTASGPFCGRMFADFGAEVVKVESPDGDPIRGLGHEYKGKSLYAASILRNKENISINLRSKQGQDLIKRLLPEFDVVIENFRPGTLEKWGLGYDELSKIKPDIILTRISGYGQTGPYSGKPGYGVIGEAMSGLRDLIGEPDRPPSRVAMPLTDYITGIYSMIGTLMALRVRDATGIGQVVDASLIESAFSFVESQVPAYAQKNVMDTRSGSRLPNSAPNTIFRCMDGEYVHIAALADTVFRRLAHAMEQPALADDPRFKTQAARNANEAEIERIVQEWAQGKGSHQIQALLDEAEVPATKIYNMKDIFADPHFKERNMLIQVPDDDLGNVTLAGVVPKLSATPGKVKWSGRRIGQDTESILSRYLGLSQAEINEMESSGVVYINRKENTQADAPAKV